MTTTHFIWDEPTDNILVEADEAGAAQAWYTNETGLYGSLVSQVRSGQVGFMHFDCQGSTREITAEAGGLVVSSGFQAFGITHSNPEESETSLAYSGEVGYLTIATFPPDSCLAIRHRSYNPRLGRWNSVDPLGAIGGPNPYVYARQNPLAFLDPAGLIDDASMLVRDPLPTNDSDRTSARPLGPLGAANGNICAVTFLDHGKAYGNMNAELGFFGGIGAVLEDALTRGEILNFIRTYKCCTVYFLGHRGGTGNEGGVSLYPPGTNTSPDFLLPDPLFENDLRRIFLDEIGCSACALNIYGCVDDPSKAVAARQQMANDTRFAVCGSLTKPGATPSGSPGQSIQGCFSSGSLFPRPWPKEPPPPQLGKEYGKPLIPPATPPAFVSPWDFSCSFPQSRGVKPRPPLFDPPPAPSPALPPSPPLPPPRRPYPRCVRYKYSETQRRWVCVDVKV